MTQIVTEFSRLAGNAPTRPCTQAAATRRRLVERCWEYMADACTAVHEAAHLCVLVDCGIRPWFADIVADDFTLGQVHFNRIQAGLDPEGVAMAAFAGAIAEEQFRREVLYQRDAVCRPSDADWAYIGCHANADRQRLERTAARRVGWLAQPIESVARELLANDRIGGRALVNCCRRYEYCFENRSVFRD